MFYIAERIAVSHCTKFDFQYTDKELICKVFDKLGLKYKTTVVKTLGVKSSAMAKRDGFNYFMEDFGNHYELSIEKSEMSRAEKKIAKKMEEEYRHEYIKIVAEQAVDYMQTKGQDAKLSQTENGFAINFGLSYEKSISIKFEEGQVIEEVQGVKGESCVSLTETLENKSPDSADKYTNSIGRRRVVKNARTPTIIQKGNSVEKSHSGRRLEL